MLKVGSQTESIQTLRNFMPITAVSHSTTGPDWVAAGASTITLERLKVGVLTEHVHPPARPVEDVVNESPGAALAALGIIQRDPKSGSQSILGASVFPSPTACPHGPQQPGSGSWLEASLMRQNTRRRRRSPAHFSSAPAQFAANKRIHLGLGPGCELLSLESFGESPDR